MSNDDEGNILEAEFKPLLSQLSLRFKDPELEGKYICYNTHGKRTPLWFIILIWTLVLVLVGRKIMILTYAYFHIVVQVLRPDVEILCFSLIVGSIVLELAIFFTNRLAFARGFIFLVSSFIQIIYSSTIYFPNPPAMIIT